MARSAAVLLRRLLQYRLSTLMLLMAAVAVAVSCWLRPYDVAIAEQDNRGDELVGHYQVRRSFLNGEEAHGKQLRRYPDGREVRWTQWEGAPDPKHSVGKCEYVSADGSIVDERFWRVDFDDLVELIVASIRPSGEFIGSPVSDYGDGLGGQPE